MTRMDKKKQIEELARIISSHCRDLPTCEGCKFEGTSTDEIECFDLFSASRIYNAGYRKQREGKWKIKSEINQMFDDVDEELYVECPFCKRTFWIPYEFEDEKIFEYARDHYPYCNCGARMKCGAE